MPSTRPRPCASRLDARARPTGPLFAHARASLARRRSCRPRRDAAPDSGARFVSWMRFCAALAARPRQRRRWRLARELLEVDGVLARGSRRALVPRSARRGPGSTAAGFATSSPAAAASAIGIDASPRGSASGSRPARGSRRTRARRSHGSQYATPSPVCPVARAARARAPARARASRHRQRLDGAERQRPGALDVVLGVEVAQLRCAAPGSAAQPLGGRLARSPARPRGTRAGPAGGPSRACVASRPETGNPACSSDVRERPQLLRVDRRVDHEALVAGTHGRAGRLPHVGDEHDHVASSATTRIGPLRRGIALRSPGRIR